jgi:hypothetical protein
VPAVAPQDKLQGEEAAVVAPGREGKVPTSTGPPSAPLGQWPGKARSQHPAPRQRALCGKAAKLPVSGLRPPAGLRSDAGLQAWGS